ncbi:MAG: hypothetical protein DMG83_19830 [Acidobacteria bacterium]|nr:MAG: hypothetical protein DMG83_19830 [Acidobacteriota bacterium]
MQAEYFWKFTYGAYDFNTILNTPLNFPIQFRKSKIDGALVRATLTNVHGFSAFTVMGHSRSRLFSPEIGGINFGTAYAPVARPDHDQGFQQTTNLQYQFSAKDLRGLWLGLTWRFDSGLVVVSVPDYATALTLTGDEQQAMGLYCGSIFATVEQPLATCNSPQRGTTLIHIVPDGTYNPDTNPSRIRSRNLFAVLQSALSNRHAIVDLRSALGRQHNCQRGIGGWRQLKGCGVFNSPSRINGGCKRIIAGPPMAGCKISLLRFLNAWPCRARSPTLRE